MPVTVRISDLTIGYNNHVVATGLSGELMSGELTCLLGTNGVGKSTLLRTLARLYRERCAIVLTDKPDVQNITVQEIVGLGRSLYTGFFGTLKDLDRKVVGQAIEQVGIGNLADRNFATLSDGEKQKVMIAKALAQETKIIFLDEPTAFLDYPSKKDVLQLLADIAKKDDKAILMSTHDFELSLNYCHRVWIMDSEKGIISSQPENVFFDDTERKFRTK